MTLKLERLTKFLLYLSVCDAPSTRATRKEPWPTFFALFAQGRKEGAIEMTPGHMTTVDAVFQNPGINLLQCRVEKHVAAGMKALYQVVSKTGEDGSAERGALPSVVMFKSQSWDGRC